MAASTTAPAVVRDYDPADREALYRVCLLTGDHGGDASHVYEDDPDALARIYVGPYLDFHPEFARVLEDQDGVCGYALATPDSRAFYDRYVRCIVPNLRRRFPLPEGDAERWTAAQSVHYRYHNPVSFCPEPYDEYPAHLHIDLIARVHRRGYGTVMMDQLFDRLTTAGVPGVHLGMGAWNERAYAFYRSIGFHELTRVGSETDGTVYMGKRLR